MNKKLTVIFIIAFVIISAFIFFNRFTIEPKEYDTEATEKQFDQKRLEEYTQIVFTKSWELQRWKMQSYEEGSESRISAQKSMVVNAFNYWVLVQKKLMKPIFAFESQIKKSFAQNVIPLNLLDDPLSGPISLAGPHLPDDEYKVLAARFKVFITNN